MTRSQVLCRILLLCVTFAALFAGASLAPARSPGRAPSTGHSVNAQGGGWD
jgi:hypothetical protein